jgi:hypothetical protein
MDECVLLHRANDMLTVLDALIPILLTNIVTDRKLEIKDIRELAQTFPSHYLKRRSQHKSGLNCGFSTRYGFNFFSNHQLGLIAIVTVSANEKKRAFAKTCEETLLFLRLLLENQLLFSSFPSLFPQLVKWEEV